MQTDVLNEWIGGGWRRKGGKDRESERPPLHSCHGGLSDRN